jgi:hypothetical protein
MLHERGPKTVIDHQTCFACRSNVKPAIQPMLAAGVFYPKCSLLVKPEEGCEPLTLLADIETEKDRIVAVTSCDVDLTEVSEADNCPTTVYTNIGLDSTYICWPEGATAEQIDLLERTKKGCVWFIKRSMCTPVPAQFAHLLETKEVASSKLGVAVQTAVPTQTTTKVKPAAASTTPK